jgi:GNAT superfamily N-acetyltransferase
VGAGGAPVTVSDFRQLPAPGGWQGEGVSERKGVVAPGPGGAAAVSARGHRTSERKGTPVPGPGGGREGAPLALAGGLLARRARAGDRAALEAMFLRCTPATVYQRFHGPVKAFPSSYLAGALAGGPAHYALVACSGARVVALASCVLTDDGASAELGILIEDGWQRRGLGRRLLGQLVAHASSRGVSHLDAQVLTEQDWIIGLLSGHGTCTSAFRLGVREVRLRLHSDRT